MRVEMFGPPTVGKSTLCRALRKFDIAHNTLGHGRVPDTWLPFAEKISAVYNDQALFKKRGPFLPDKFLRKTLQALATAGNADCFSYPVTYDELVVQCGLSMAIRLLGDWSWYFRELPLPGLLVVLTAPDKTLMERNRQRGYYRDHSEKTMRVVRVMPKILDILHDRQCPMLEFDTSTLVAVEMARLTLKEIQCIAS